MRELDAFEMVALTMWYGGIILAVCTVVSRLGRIIELLEAGQ